MKKLTGFLMVAALISSLAGCKSGGKGNGELLGVQGRKPWFQDEPNGMVFIPQGVFQAGQSDQDVMFSLNNQTKTVSVKAFFMDDTEITNNEYRQFVFWVRDSIAHTILGNVTEDEKGVAHIDWSKKIKYNDNATADELAEMYYPESEQIYGRREMNFSNLKYRYKSYDFAEAAKKSNAKKTRSQFLKDLNPFVYPDTLVWTRDFAFSYNEPQTQKYFSHPAYDDYPVVGVTWEQANAFCNWRTDLLNDYRLTKGLPEMPPFRLPTEWEFEYAARAGHTTSPYPWGGPYVRNDKGCFLANFKPGRGNYTDDGGFYTVKVRQYNPNDYGLYDMSGNVAEWTSTAFEESVSSTVHDLNPDYKYNAKAEEDKVRKRKVIRGGSWKDIGFMLQTSTRTYEYQDTAKSYVGFRCVMDFLGRDIKDF